MPSINERVKYVSPYRTGTYDAVVTAVNPDGTVAIDVYMPVAVGRRYAMDLEPVVRLRGVSYGPEGLARPLVG
jgi:hypothetical protein